MAAAASAAAALCYFAVGLLALVGNYCWLAVGLVLFFCCWLALLAAAAAACAAKPTHLLLAVVAQTLSLWQYCKLGLESIVFGLFDETRCPMRKLNSARTLS